MLGFAWTLAVALALVLPDVRPLIGVARTPIILIGMPFGGPAGIGLSTLFPWPVVNQWALDIPLGVSREFLREEARETPDIWLAGAAPATLAVGGATLTLGLVPR